MKEYTINVYNVNTLETIDTFVAEFENVTDLSDFMEEELHNYNEKYTNLDYKVKGETKWLRLYQSCLFYHSYHSYYFGYFVLQW